MRIAHKLDLLLDLSLVQTDMVEMMPYLRQFIALCLVVFNFLTVS